MLTLNDVCTLYTVEDYNKTITHKNIVIRMCDYDAGKVLFDYYADRDYVLEIKDNSDINVGHLKFYLLSNFKSLYNLRTKSNYSILRISKEDLLNFEINLEISHPDCIKNANDYINKIKKNIVFQLYSNANYNADKVIDQLNDIKQIQQMLLNHLFITNNDNDNNP